MLVVEGGRGWERLEAIRHEMRSATCSQQKLDDERWGKVARVKYHTFCHEDLLHEVIICWKVLHLMWL